MSAQTAERTAAVVAKAALRRLALAQLEPTPENYARAWAEETGAEPPGGPRPAAAPNAGPAWAALIERLGRQLDRGGRQWTAARRKDSLQRVLAGSRSDGDKLLQRLQSLIQAWETDRPDESFDEAVGAAPAPVRATDFGALAPAEGEGAGPEAADRAGGAWPPLAADLGRTLHAALPADEPRARAWARQLAALDARLAAGAPVAEIAAAVQALCGDLRRWFGHRHALVEDLAALCRELTSGLVELSEDQSWARGQAESLRARLADGVLDRRSLKAGAELLAQARASQQRLRGEHAAAREALKDLLARMLGEVGELGAATGAFEQAVERHAQAVAGADSLQALAGVVETMLADSRAVKNAVTASRERLEADRARADELQQRVRALESELRRIAEEASTDALTQVANRRGLERAFEAESARAGRELADAGDAAAGSATSLAVGLIDIDNFKKLNDRLGHAAGDEALKSLAAAVRERLRPVDHIARFGGEEFVLLMPGTGTVDDAQQALTRLQRSLSAALFMHEGEEVFVTFSAGVTAWRAGEPLADALGRADEALYEAKRSGKNRTCKA